MMMNLHLATTVTERVTLTTQATTEKIQNQDSAIPDSGSNYSAIRLPRFQEVRMAVLLGVLLSSIIARRPETCAEPEAAPILRVVFIRHAESENNLLNLVSYQHYLQHRRADPAISALGHEQAAAAGAFLSDSRAGLLAKVSDMYISPTLRTLQTAKHIAARLPTVSTRIWADIWEVCATAAHALRAPRVRTSC